MAKTGRPSAKIDWGKVDRYLQAQCNGAGIAGLLGIHPDTLYNAVVEKYGKEYGITTFSAYAAIKKGEGLELLRAKQFATAMEGDKTMQIWLGKQYLDQKDKTDTTSGDKPIVGDLRIIVDNSDTAKSLKELRDGFSKTK